MTISISGTPIRLPEERWSHIIKNHPEIKDSLQDILETVKSPRKIQLEDSGELLALSFDPTNNKFLVVAYRELSLKDGFILTAYFARRLSQRRTTIWTQ